MGGATEVAEALGVSRQRLLKLRERADFPDPIGELAQGPIWDLDEVKAWNGSGLRRSTSGRPSAGATAQTLGGRFLVEDKIDSGGFADVFRAVDRKKTGRVPSMAAVKIIKDDLVADDLEAVRRFKRELRMLDGELEHPHIIPILGHGEVDGGRVWYAMPLARGSLRASLDEMAGRPVLILDLMRQVCSGLEYIHDKAIFHRDLKPENILRLDASTWAISDFGLAVQAERKSTILTSAMRYGLGSQFYSAPEQIRCARDADHRSDIFSLGKILQELVTGETPMSTLMPASPFRPVVEKATEQSPGKRYQSVKDFLTAVEHAVEAPATKWETAEETAEKLSELLRDPQGYESLRTFLTWAERLDEGSRDNMQALAVVMPSLGSSSIAELLDNDEESFMRIYRRFTDHLAQAGFPFASCDGLADVCKRVVRAADGHSVLRQTVNALAELGRGHNRWHVRDVLTEILQGIREPEPALAALEGLRDAGRSAVHWSFENFTIRSLHPNLRGGIEAILDNEH
ncbi:serine/threonine-protein kinase [Dactylosporangium matsuzakiense]|nr:serine/threonine-protein kinase [Dactylosporangium matsuzakiense]